MTISTSLILATLVGAVVAGSACTQKAADDTPSTIDGVLDRAKQGSDTALEATREGLDEALDATREAGGKAADASQTVAQQAGEKTKEIAVAVGSKTKEVVSATGDAITDGWITTKVSAKFVDGILLKGSNINVDTSNHVVTLKGTVGSEAAKTRAVAIARDTEGVTRVVNQLVVKAS